VHGRNAVMLRPKPDVVELKHNLKYNLVALYHMLILMAVGHPTYIEKLCWCERLISEASFEVNEIALRHLYNALRLCSRAVIVIVNSKTFISARM